jgi:hypothetical protein
VGTSLIETEASAKLPGRSSGTKPTRASTAIQGDRPALLRIRADAEEGVDILLLGGVGTGGPVASR